jgi:hypothetical protein
MMSDITYIHTSFTFFLTHPLNRTYALQALLDALAPLIGAEAMHGDKAVSKGWADSASTDEIDRWRQRGTELVQDEMNELIQNVYTDEYARLMRKVRIPLQSFSLLLS